MKKHILSKFSKVYEFQKINNNYYDEVTQVSYKDSKLREKTISSEWTGITETVENSDPDEFRYQGPTVETATVENSDADEFRCKERTELTFTLESSDEDELSLGLWSKETRMLESSDSDEFVC